MRRLSLTVLTAVMLVAAAVPAGAQKEVTGPVDIVGERRGAAFEIRVPAEWNGTLVVYAHGYRDKADQPGQVDNTSADAFVNDAFEAVLLGAGYSVAGSAYRDNGWAVQEGINDTRDLVNHFGSVVGKPDTVILVGFSMGSVIAFESIERFPGIYDGAIPACAVGAGAPRAFDGTLAFALAWDAVFGWPSEWGTPFDVRDDLSLDADVLPQLFGILATDPQAGLKLEFIRRVTGIPIGPEWPGSILFFATEGRAELERRAGGPVGENLDHTYELGSADRAFLTAGGLDAGVLDGWLAHMDVNRFQAPANSRGYIERYADYTGSLRRPVLTLHTVVDALVPPAHISKYTETVQAAGRADYLVSAFTSGVGHCAFTPAQLLAAVDVMQEWIEAGDTPQPGDFPAALGFVPLDPPEWPQP